MRGQTDRFLVLVFLLLEVPDVEIRAVRVRDHHVVILWDDADLVALHAGLGT